MDMQRKKTFCALTNWCEKYLPFSVDIPQRCEECTDNVKFIVKCLAGTQVERKKEIKKDGQWARLKEAFKKCLSL